jgi:hypothetical protein
VCTGSGSPVQGAAVTFTLSKADDLTVAFSATTATSGSASASYRVKQEDSRGTWHVTAGATLGGVYGEGVLTFEVE